MAEQFYTILTKLGKAKIANATALGTKVNLTKFQVGDGNGSYYNPTEDQTQLRNKVWESNIRSITVDENNPNWIVLETIIPGDVGGFMIREAAALDDEGNMIAVGKYPETYKPVVGDGSTKDLVIKMILEVSNTASVTLRVDPTVILATQKDIKVLNNKIENIKVPVTSVNSKTGAIELKAEDIKTNSGESVESQLADIANKAGKVGTKEVDESNIKDNYTLRYDAEKDKLIYVDNKISRTYGVKIDTTNSNPETAVTYIDMSTGFTPAKGNNGVFQWGSWQDKFPFNAIKPCLYKNGVVNYYIDPNDYTKKIDGSNADITSGNDGDVMIEFPKIYWKFERIRTDLYIRISETQADSSYKCLAHMRGSSEKDKCYISAYLGSELSGKLRSLSGKTPTANKTIGAFRTLAQANGSGYDQMAYYQLLMLQILYVVMFKNLDSQTALGRGYVDGNSGTIPTGGTNAKGLFYGENTGKFQNKFCGIEGFYGNCYYWIDGLYSDSNRNILIGNQNFNDTGSGYTNYGQGATSNIGGYINDVQGTSETGFIAKNVVGSATTYYCDYGVLSAGCLLYFGGDWSIGSSAGAFRLSVSTSAAVAFSIIGARLLAL